MSTSIIKTQPGVIGIIPNGSPNTWNSVNHLLSPNNSEDLFYASCDFVSSFYSPVLYLRNWNFDLPEGSVVEDIILTVVKRATGSGAVNDLEIRLYHPTAPAPAFDESNLTLNYSGSPPPDWSGSNETVNYNNAGWNKVWTENEINNPMFGCWIAAVATNLSTTALIDYVQLEVVYGTNLTLVGEGGIVAGGKTPRTINVTESNDSKITFTMPSTDLLTWQYDIKTTDRSGGGLANHDGYNWRCAWDEVGALPPRVENLEINGSPSTATNRIELADEICTGEWVTVKYTAHSNSNIESNTSPIPINDVVEFVNDSFSTGYSPNAEVRNFKADVGNTGSWTHESEFGDTNGFTQHNIVDTVKSIVPVQAIYNPVASKGVVVSGEAYSPRTLDLDGTGGIVAGGSAEVTTAIAVSGGIVVGGQSPAVEPTFSKGGVVVGGKTPTTISVLDLDRTFGGESRIYFTMPSTDVATWQYDIRTTDTSGGTLAGDNSNTDVWRGKWRGGSTSPCRVDNLTINGVPSTATNRGDLATEICTGEWVTVKYTAHAKSQTDNATPFNLNDIIEFTNQSGFDIDSANADVRNFKVDIGNTGSWTHESEFGDTNGFTQQNVVVSGGDSIVPVQAIYNPTISSGVVVSGGNEAVHGIFGNGGIVVSGESILTTSPAFVVTGGVVVGGLSVIDPILSEGGLVCGGSANESIVWNDESEYGGVVASGLAALTSEEKTEGGTVVGGTSNLIRVITIPEWDLDLDGTQLVNQNLDTTATAHADFWYDRTERRLSWLITYSGFDYPIDLAELKFGPTRTSGPTQMDLLDPSYLESTDPLSGMAQIIDLGLESDLLDGNLYLILGTSADNNKLRTQLWHFGITVGGEASVEPYYELTEGGVVLGGQSLIDPIWPEGGAVVGSSADVTFNDTFVPSGGMVTGGLPLLSFENIDGTGGVVVGGESIDYEIGSNIEATGGVITGGASENSIGMPIGGGVVCSGSAIVESTYNTSLDGGVVTGGSTLSPIIYNADTTGGVVIYGTSAIGINILVGGGIVISGTHTSEYTSNPVISGGIVTSGESLQTFIDYFIASGGLVGGGRARADRIKSFKKYKTGYCRALESDNICKVQPPGEQLIRAQGDVEFELDPNRIRIEILPTWCDIEDKLQPYKRTLETCDAGLAEVIVTRQRGKVPPRSGRKSIRDRGIAFSDGNS